MDFCLLDDVPTPYYDEIKNCGGNIYVLPNLKKISSHVKNVMRFLKMEIMM